jgi:hypothetical protein
MRVIRVTHLKDYSIHVVFDDGVEGDVCLNDLVELGIFRVLKDPSLFSKVYTTGYSIAWSDQLEIDVATIYAELSGKTPAEAFSPAHIYAAD